MRSMRWTNRELPTLVERSSVAAGPGRVPLRRVRLFPGIRLQGPLRYRLSSLLRLVDVMVRVTSRQLLGRPSVTGWSWAFETSNAFLRAQLRAAFRQPTVTGARQLLDSLQFKEGETPDVRREGVTAGSPPGEWFIPSSFVPGRTLLYLHGGGYVFNVRSHGHGIALVAEAAGARTFSLDYRLAPEHPYPAQLEDALAAYRWLLTQGHAPGSLVIAGDSAGGHLMLLLLAEIRHLGLPLPALGVGLCPWIDPSEPDGREDASRCFDWIQWEEVRCFSRLFHGDSGKTPEQTSAFSLDLQGFPPLYLQAGGRETLCEMIEEFYDFARAQGLSVNLDVWDSMTHDFQFFGNLLPESRESLDSLSHVIDRHAGRPCPRAQQASASVREALPDGCGAGEYA